MANRLKLTSGFSPLLLPCFLIIASLLPLAGADVFAQGEIFDENELGGGPIIGFASANSFSGYKFGFQSAVSPYTDIGFALKVVDEGYRTISPNFTFYPVKVYGKSSRLMITFQGEYNHTFQKGYHKSYLMGFSLIAGGHSIDRRSVFLPYLFLGYANDINDTETEHNVIGYGLTIGANLGKSDNFIAVSFGVTRFNGENTVGGTLGFFPKKSDKPIGDQW